MRTTGPFTQYNRYVAQKAVKLDYNDYYAGGPKAKGLPDSLLGLFAAGEARFLVSFVDWAQADATTYEAKK